MKDVEHLQWLSLHWQFTPLITNYGMHTSYSHTWPHNIMVSPCFVIDTHQSALLGHGLFLQLLDGINKAFV